MYLYWLYGERGIWSNQLGSQASLFPILRFPKFITKEVGGRRKIRRGGRKRRARLKKKRRRKRREEEKRRVKEGEQGKKEKQEGRESVANT